jgi:hypothetical protein
MFTLEVAGKPIAVTNASEDETREIFESDAFKEDLKSVKSEGTPIWDGLARVRIRPATRDEIAAFETTPIGEGEEVDEDAPMIMFLVEIDGPETGQESGGGDGYTRALH